MARLRRSSDERLVRRVRAGNEEAFTILWERYQRPLLSYCRHLLGSHHEAEEAVQQSFTNAYRALSRGDERELHVRPWLYRIARNQCFSILRARRPQAELGEDEPSLVGLSDEVADRAELRAMLRDLAGLPTDQREALVLAELHDNSHAQVAEILGCEQSKVKALVFQARASLMKSRAARELQCNEVQEQLSVLRGGSLRRAVLRRHLAECEACSLFAAEVKRQRAALAIVLPVVPTGALKLGAAAAFAASATASATSATTATTATTAGVAAKLGVSTSLLKSAATTLAVTTAAAGGVATTAEVAQEVTRDARPPAARQAPQAVPPGQVAPGPAGSRRPGAAVPGTRRQNPGAGRAGKAPKQRPAAAAPPGARTGPGAAKPARPFKDDRPLTGKRPKRPRPSKQPSDRPAREQPRPRPRPDADRRPPTAVEPAPPVEEPLATVP
jgi:RNA polymerase sigma factor (sigma-70 family)